SEVPVVARRSAPTTRDRKAHQRHQPVSLLQCFRVTLLYQQRNCIDPWKIVSRIAFESLRVSLDRIIERRCGHQTSLLPQLLVPVFVDPTQESERFGVHTFFLYELLENLLRFFTVTWPIAPVQGESELLLDHDIRLQMIWKFVGKTNHLIPCAHVTKRKHQVNQDFALS